MVFKQNEIISEWNCWKDINCSFKWFPVSFASDDFPHLSLYILTEIWKQTCRTGRYNQQESKRNQAFEGFIWHNKDCKRLPEKAGDILNQYQQFFVVINKVIAYWIFLILYCNFLDHWFRATK